MGRWDIVSPGSGRVRGMDTLLGVLSYLRKEKKDDEREAVRKAERDQVRKEELARKKELMNIEKLKVERGNYTALVHTAKEYLADEDPDWDRYMRGIQTLGQGMEKRFPGMGAPYEAVLKGAPQMVRTKNPITGEETYFSDEELNEQRKKYMQEVQLRSLAGVQATGGEIDKGETKWGKKAKTEQLEADREKAKAKIEAAQKAKKFEKVPFETKDGRKVYARNQNEFDKFSADTDNYTRGEKIDKKSGDYKPTLKPVENQDSTTTYHQIDSKGGSIDTGLKVPKKQTTTGQLSDNNILQHIREITNYNTTKTSNAWDKFLEYVDNDGMTRGAALNKLQKEMVSNVDDNKDDDFSSLWE